MKINFLPHYVLIAFSIAYATFVSSPYFNLLIGNIWVAYLLSGALSFLGHFFGSETIRYFKQTKKLNESAVISLLLVSGCLFAEYQGLGIQQHEKHVVTLTDQHELTLRDRESAFKEELANTESVYNQEQQTLNKNYEASLAQVDAQLSTARTALEKAQKERNQWVRSNLSAQANQSIQQLVAERTALRETHTNQDKSLRTARSNKEKTLRDQYTSLRAELLTEQDQEQQHAEEQAVTFSNTFRLLSLFFFVLAICAASLLRREQQIQVVEVVEEEEVPTNPTPNTPNKPTGGDDTKHITLTTKPFSEEPELTLEEAIRQGLRDLRTICQKYKVNVKAAKEAVDKYSVAS